ncbi:substrate-binding domain-containing protein [Pseudonocardia sp. TRM90224]|uniref:substrate-binding domain-containing protein n=1 Tax=Pseudonocardia sp. TRM90224 TaxID=2812678 RepID=UPI001E5A5E3B|nr:substrate-binding domain-containing protein [Pseudonocardia sp. TRM90224]
MRIVRRKALVGAVLAAGLAAVLTACGGGSGTTGAPAQASVAAVIKGLDNPFFQAMQKGIDEQGAATGTRTTVQAATSITDTTGQADKLVGLAGQDFGCYIVNPISGTNLVQGLAQLAAAGKTIVNIDSPVQADAATAAGAKIATYIGTDNVAAGKLAATEMSRLLTGGGSVAVVGGIAGDVTSGARVEGFRAGLTGGVTVVQEVAANWERQEALTQATTIMAAQPDLKGFFAANDDMGLGIAQAVANAGRTGQIQVISVDGNPDALTAVSNGELAATVAQYPYVIGQLGVDACRAAAAGTALPSKVDAPVQLVTKDNAQQAIQSAPRPPAPYENPFATR